MRVIKVNMYILTDVLIRWPHACLSATNLVSIIKSAVRSSETKLAVRGTSAGYDVP